MASTSKSKGEITSLFKPRDVVPNKSVDPEVADGSGERGGARSGGTTTPFASRPPSRVSSTISVKDDDQQLPNDVTTMAQLDGLPDECKSGDPQRPLRHVDEMGAESCYALRPMLYSVLFILLVEMLERFAYYGIDYTSTGFLTGVYSDDWNAGLESVQATTYVSVSIGVAYTTPFLGAYLADAWVGDYWALIIGSLGFYLPGLFLIASTTVPGLLGDDFNRTALATGLLFLWPMGAGIVKSVVNIFGAKQFHPLLQSAQLETYFINFYLAINIGSLAGITIVPLLAQHNITAAYFFPVVTLTLGVGVFLAGSKRYVKPMPKAMQVKKMVVSSNADTISLWTIFHVSMLVVPFNIVYAQMATVFIVQGTVMEKAFGFIDAPMMDNCDAGGVLVLGAIIGNWLYPMLASRGIKIPTATKFAIGSFLGVLAMAYALMVEWMIHAEYARTGQKISVLWQAGALCLIAAGEIFAVSAAYEAAFRASPPENKVLASAANLFCIGGLPNVICIGLYHVCEAWFTNGRGNRNIIHIDDYVTAHVANYFLLLLSIAAFGVALNLLPAVRDFVSGVEEKAISLIKTPKTPVGPHRLKVSEQSPLLRAQRHQTYLKFGSGPELCKQGSMRAGVAMNNQAKRGKRLRRDQLQKLYRSAPVMTGVSSVIAGRGNPIPAGTVIPPKIIIAKGGEKAPLLQRTNSDRS